MIETKNFLFEIGVEELPTKAAINLAPELAVNIQNALTSYGFKFKAARSFSSPRRLAVLVEDLAVSQDVQLIEKRGPAWDRAFDQQGLPTPAALGFAKSCGVEMSELGELNVPEGRWLVYRTVNPGKKLTAVIAEILKHSLEKLSIPRLMSWGDYEIKFVRPVHWILLMHGSDVIDANLLGVQSDRLTYGHRVHHPAAIQLHHVDEYEQALLSAYVIADFSARKAKILQGLQKFAQQYQGELIYSEDLLNEVNALVEWPVVLSGKIGQEFLEVPAECLICSMQQHQKYFPLQSTAKKLLPYFIFVANIESKDPSQVISGNERVLRARLKDAKFFYFSDLKHGLASQREKLAQIIFQNRLGTLEDKTQRIINLAQSLALDLFADPELCARTASLAKCDLTTAMVGEFPELQGIMGKYYALAAKEENVVAESLEQYYYPRRAQDKLPELSAAIVVALADRLDTLVGLYGIGERVAGDKDPFGLRRIALAILRLIIEKQLALDLRELLSRTVANYQQIKLAADTVEELIKFSWERLVSYYTEQNISKNILRAVLDKNITQPYDLDLRVKALAKFIKLAQVESLVKAHKRSNNILTKEAGSLNFAQEIKLQLLQEPGEINLHAKLCEYEKIISGLVAQQNYSQALAALAELQPVVDKFFDSVMVMVEEPELKINRLLLLAKLRDLLEIVANISVLTTGA